MDARRFDVLAKVLSRLNSRRQLIALLATLPGVGGLLGMLSSDDASGHGRHQRRVKRHKHGKPRKRRAGNRKKKPCPPCVRRKKGRCMEQLPDGTTCAGGTCQGGQCLRCTDPALPNFCASTNRCLPACLNNEVFSPDTCTCACTPRTCCNCTGTTASFCSEAQPTLDACGAACVAANPGVASEWSFLGAPEVSAKCDATAPSGCLFYCGV